tara:strand:+ start:629 stop:754 length:126 start_codon:yes stop_codon:yes gene_type:complete
MKKSSSDWAEMAIMFVFLAGAIIVLAYAGALLGEVIFRLAG